MLCNYGYEDGSGLYYIRIDTDKCCECEEKPCVKVCPAGLFEICLDDYDDEIVKIREDVRNQLKDKCIVCKNRENSGKEQERLRCMQACPYGALKHTW